MADEKRSDYLKSLNKMRSGYQNSGNPLVNPEDDSTSVGEELSSFAYMDTEIPDADSQADRNGWQRLVDTVSEPNSKVTSGFFDFLDDAFDFGVSVASWVTGLGSAISNVFQGKDWNEGWESGTSWAKDVIEYDWQSQAKQVTDMLSPRAILSGDIANGEKWASIGSSSESKNQLESRDKSSFVNDWGSFGNTMRSVEEQVGYMLPSVVLGVATGGASIPAQAAIQGGVSAGTAYGRSVESALGEGADYNQAMAYGAAKGAVSGALTAASVGIGGSAMNKFSGSGMASKVGDSMAKAVAKKTSDATIQHISGIVGDVIARAGVSSIEAGAKTLAEPLLKSIYDDGKAIDEAYNQGKIGEQLRDSMIQAAATTAIISAGKQAGRYAMTEGKYDSEGKYVKGSRTSNWNSEYFDSMAYRTEYGNAKREAKRIAEKYERKLGGDIMDVINGKKTSSEVDLSDPKYQSILADYSNELSAWNERYSGLVKSSLESLPDNEYTKQYKETVEEKPSSGTPLIGEGSNEVNKKWAELRDYEVNRAKADARVYLTARNIQQTSKNPADDFWESAKKEYEERKAPYSQREKATDGKWAHAKDDEDVIFSGSGCVVNPGKKEISFGIESKGGAVVVTGVDSAKKATAAITFLSKGGTLADAVGGIDASAASFGVPELGSGGVDTSKGLKMPNGVISKVASDSAALSALAKTDPSKSYAVDNGDGTFSSIEPIEGKDGALIATVDKKTNEVKGVSLVEDEKKLEARYVNGHNVIGRDDESKIINTKAVGKASGNPLPLEIDDPYDPTSFHIVTDRYGDKGDYFAYSEKPLYADDLTSMGWKDVSSKLGISESLGKTFSMMAGKGADKLLGWLSGFDEDESEAGVIKKLGYDAYINEKTNRLVVSDLSRIITKSGGTKVDGKESGEMVRGEHRGEGDERAEIRRDDGRGIQRDGEGDEGKSVATSTQRRLRFSRELKDSKRYETGEDAAKSKGIELTDKEKKAKFVRESDYTEDMAQIADKAKRIGVQILFALSDERDIDLNRDSYAYYAVGKGYEVFSLDTLDNIDLTKIAAHENCHALFDMHGMERGTGAKRSLFDAIDEELSGKTNDYGLARLFAKYSKIYLSADVKLHGMLKSGELGRYLSESMSMSNDETDEVLEEIINQLYSGQEGLKGKHGLKFQKKLHERIDGFIASEEKESVRNDMGGEYLKNDYFDDSGYFENLADDEEGLYEERKLRKAPATTWRNAQLSDKAKEFAEANKKEPSKSASFVANKDFDTMEAEITAVKNPDTGKWDVTTYDRYTDQTIRNRSFKKWSTVLRYISGVYGDDVRRITTESVSRQRESHAHEADTPQAHAQIAQATAGANANTLTNASATSSEKSLNNASYIANKGFETTEDDVSITYNEETGRYDVKAHDNYIDKDLPTKSFKRFRKAKEYAQSVFGELTQVSGSGNRDRAGEEGNDSQIVASANTDAPTERTNGQTVSETPAQEAGTQNETAIAAPEQNGSGNAVAPRRNTDAEAQSPQPSQRADGTVKLVSDKERNSAAKLIESGADVSKDLKVRLKDVRDAFVAAVKETLPEGGKFRISADAVRETMAEVDLVKDKKKTPIVAENMLKRLKDVNVTIQTDGGEERMKLGDFMTPEQEKEAFGLLTSTLNGKAQPTELAKWAKELRLERMKTKANVETIKKLSTINRRIASASKEYLSAPGMPPIELSVYSKLIEGVNGPFTAKSLKRLADNVRQYYTEDNFGEMLNGYGLGINPAINSICQALDGSFVEGKGISAQQTEFGNFILEAVGHEMAELAKGIKSKNYQEARAAVVLAQAAFGSDSVSKGGWAQAMEKVKNAFAAFDQNVRSPISVLEGILGEDNPFVVHLSQGAKDCENEQKDLISSFKDSVYGKDAIERAGFKSTDELERALAEKVEFKGRKIEIDQALKIINTQKTAKTPEAFLKRGGSFDINGKRVDTGKLTQEDMDGLISQIPESVMRWNDEAVAPFFNGTMKDYIEGRFKEISGVGLKMVDGFYYPTSAVGEKAPDLSKNGGSVNLSDWGITYFKERVTNTNASYNLNGGILADINSYIAKVSQWGVWAPWYKKLRMLENTQVFGKGTTLNAVLEKNMVNWKPLREFIHRTALGLKYDGSVSLLGTVDNALGGIFSNLQQVAMMDPFTQVKTLGSDFTGWQFFGAETVFKGLSMYWQAGGPVSEAHAREVIERYSPTLKSRFASSEAFSANLGKKVKGKFTNAWTTPVRFLDMHIHLKAYYMALAKAEKELGSGAKQDEIERRAVRLLEEYSDTTQPTTSAFRVGMYRAGANGKIVKQVFGMFQSMGQNIYQGLYDVTVGWKNKLRIMGNYAKASDEFSARAEEYAKKMTDAEDKAKNAGNQEERDKFEKEAKDFKFHKEGNEQSKETVDEALKKMKGKYTGRYYAGKLSAYIAGLIGSGLALTLIGKLKKKAYGTEEWNDWDAKELTEEAAYQSFVNWIPFIGTIANSIRNDSDLTVFTIDNLNTLVSSAKDMVESFSGGDGSRMTGKTLQFLMYASQLFGIPAQSMWKIVNGVWYNVDKESNVSFRERMGLLTSASIKSGYSDALKKGQKAKAVAYIDVWTGAYSSGSSKEVSEEIYRLNRLGITGVTPSAYPTTYVNDDGEITAMNQKETSDYHAIFSKSSEQTRKMVSSSAYKELDDEYKGKAMKALWGAYSSAAKHKSYGKAMTGKAAKLVAATNGDIDLARYIVGLQKLSGKSTADAVKEANSLSGYTKAEKLLMLWLNGSTLTEKNVNILVSWLTGEGSSASDAVELFS